MRLFIDESGSFTTGERACEGTAVAVGLTVPVSVEEALWRAFCELRSRLTGSSTAEMKSSRWPESYRRELCRVLDHCPGTYVRSVILDLTQFRGSAVPEMRATLNDSLISALGSDLPPRVRQVVTDMAAWHGNLSDVEVIKLYTWANCVDHLLRDLAVVQVPPEDRAGWREMQIVIDGPPQSRNTRHGRFFVLAIQFWLKQWSESSPVTVIGADHPLVEHFGADGGLDLPRVIEQLRFADSRDEIGLQIVDIAAAIVRRAAESRGSDPEALSTFGWLMKASVARPGVGVGLLTPFAALAGTPCEGFETMIREYDLAQIRRGIEPNCSMLLMGPYLTGEFPGVWSRW